ncbi:chaplin family protein [Streptomyces capparidis]
MGMSPRLAARAAVSAVLLLAAGLLPATAARAGGIVDILAPAFGNGCVNTGNGAAACGTATASPGNGAGNTIGAPVTGPTNYCGNADALPLPAAPADDADNDADDRPSEPVCTNTGMIIIEIISPQATGPCGSAAVVG